MLLYSMAHCTCGYMLASCEYCHHMLSFAVTAISKCSPHSIMYIYNHLSGLVKVYKCRPFNHLSTVAVCVNFHWLSLSYAHKYFLLAHPRICACWPSGLYSGLPDYGQEIDPTASTFFFFTFFSLMNYS